LKLARDGHSLGGADSLWRHPERCSEPAGPLPALLPRYLITGQEAWGSEVLAQGLDHLEDRWRGEGPPSRRATTSTRGRSGRSGGARTTDAPTRARHPAAAWRRQEEPSSRPAAPLVGCPASGGQDMAWLRGNPPAIPGRTLGGAGPAERGKRPDQTSMRALSSHCCIIDQARPIVEVPEVAKHPCLGGAVPFPRRRGSGPTAGRRG